MIRKMFKSLKDEFARSSLIFNILTTISMIFTFVGIGMIIAWSCTACLGYMYATWACQMIAIVLNLAALVVQDNF